MIRVRQVKVNINEDTIDNIKKKASKKLFVRPDEILNIKIHEQSIDARNKPELFFVYTVDVEVNNEEYVLKRCKSNDVLITPHEEYIFNITGTNQLKNRPIIVGMGPAGLFCAYLLAETGYKPVIIDRGEPVEERVKTIEEFWNTGTLKTNSNVQFGEGGAGTFSDGKLVSQVKDSTFRRKKVFDTFIKHGADPKIGYVNKPHIGTDKLRDIIKGMREEIISKGGEFHYNTCLTDIEIDNNEIKRIQVNNSKWIDTDIVVLALGHSARDTFKMLYDKQLKMAPKPFAVGIRIQHPQDMINKNQYGLVSHPKLEAASYKLTYKATNGRGVYSFCMCPGGYVVNASSEENRLAINGMSNNARDSKNANSALIVTITPDDFGPSPLDGIEFQRRLEEKAFEVGNGNIPIQLYKDYKNNNVTTKLGSIEPIFKGNYKLSNINEVFPNYINESLKEAIEYFDRKIKGYSNGDAIVAAVESRTSSPIKIERDENGESSILGIYPCGEGAGYAGGITSAAIDGIKVAELIASKYKN
jgi:hypothetical protein